MELTTFIYPNPETDPLANRWNRVFYAASAYSQCHFDPRSPRAYCLL